MCLRYTGNVCDVLTLTSDYVAVFVGSTNCEGHVSNG